MNRDGLVVPLDRPQGENDPGRPIEQIEVAAAQSQGETVLPEPEPDPALSADGAPSPPLAEARVDTEDEPPVAAPRPPLIRFVPVAATSPSPPVDAYSLRLVSGRALYDPGVLVQQSPALRALVPGARLRAHPHDLGHLGVTTGDQVRVTSSGDRSTLGAVADSSVLRGSAVLPFNQPGPGAADLIDARQPVTDVRVETVAPGSGHVA